MTTPTTSTTSTSKSGGRNENQPGAGSDVAKTSSSALKTEQGNTTIADGVVSKIAGLAAREVAGVHALGGGAARAMGALRDRIPGASTSHSRGVNVEVGETQAAVDLEIVAEYGVAIADLARSIRRNVISSVEGMTGLDVVEVNISVNDIHLPTDDSDDDKDSDRQRESEPARVQ